MNQDNNNSFELSGTLGSLNDAALNNLANQNTPETPANNENILATEEPVPTEIEMLDVSTPNTVATNVEPVVEAQSLNNDNFNAVDIGSDLTENTIGIPQPDFNPIPSNFDIGDIGSVPPVDPNGKGVKKSKKKTVLFIMVLIIIILAVGALIYYYLKVSKGSLANAVETKEITLELGEELPTDANQYATFKSVSSSNCILDTKGIDIKKAGTYEYEITCGSNTYKGNVILKDTKAPNVKTKTIVKKIDETISAEEFISECNEASKCIYSFENADLATGYVKTAGTYDLNIIINDASNNSTTVPVKLIVIDSSIKVYLNCVLSDQQLEGFNGVVSYNDKIGISADSKYVGLYFKNKQYIVSTEEEYNSIKTNYTTNGVLDLNDGQGTPTFDDATLTITVEEILSGDSEFGTNYTSIKSHYEAQNYRCNIINVN